MKTRMRDVIIWMVLVLCFVQYGKAEWIFIDKPGATMTFPRDISGNFIVGDYWPGIGGGSYRAFLYNFVTEEWAELEDIPEVAETETAAWGIDGDNIVGFYNEPGRSYRGFIYNKADKTWDFFDSLYGETWPTDIDGDYVVGYYGNSGAYHGFLYNMMTKEWETLPDIPGAYVTWPEGMDMSAGTSGMIVGGGVGAGNVGWVYDIANEAWNPFNSPSAPIYGIDGDNIVGFNIDGSGIAFLYDGTNFTTFKVNGSITTTAWDIDGRNIVGVYNIGGNPGHGFLYTFNRPPVAVCQDVLAPVGVNGYTDASVDGGSYDPDEDYIDFSQNPAGPYPVGVYNVELTVTDPYGALDSCQSMLVVYDASGGFVTGGGWIWSPKGAYVADPWLEGKANFGFVSKYQKGANVPTGQTEFVFQVGDLNFHSSSYNWLVVAGAKAMFKGVGTINGAGDYGFMLSAVDAALTPSTSEDRFRIKIWDKNAGDTVVYDNQMGDDDNADVTTAIGGGSIVIHKK